MDNAIRAVAVIGVLGAGISGGVAFAFSNFVMAALRDLPHPEGMRAMQQINKAVYNPVFMGGLLATTLLSVTSVAIGMWSAESTGAILLALGGVSYVGGVFLVTALANVPLNNALQRCDPTGGAAASEWGRYVRKWGRWNHARTGMSLASVLLYAAALWVH